MAQYSLHPKIKRYLSLSPDKKLEEIWPFVQRGLVYTSPYAIYASFWLKDYTKVTREELAILSENIRSKINRSPSLNDRHTSAILGTSIDLWKNICKKEKLPLPKGLELNYPSNRDPSMSKVFRKSGRVHKNSGVNLWFHIKSNDAEACDAVFEYIKTELGNKVKKLEKVEAASKSDVQPPCCGAHMGPQHKDFNDGKVMGNRFSENLNNPADPMTISKHSIVGTEDVHHLGASYVFAQNFLINWNQIHSMSEDKVEDLIGRKTNDTIIPNRDTRSHTGESRIAEQSDRYKRLREKAMSMPKFLRGNEEVDDLGRKLMEGIAKIAMETFTNPVPQFEAQLKDLGEKYGTAEHPFGVQIQPGVGTFENHVDMGAWSGASADGRRLAQSVASDASASPSADDLPIDHQYAPFARALAGAAGNGMKAFTDGAPTDFNIPEDYPFEDLMKILKQFAEGKSSNILTITTCSPATMLDAVDSPERYDLLRVRTGGWTEFFTAMFPNKQAQQLRRPISTPE